VPISGGHLQEISAVLQQDYIQGMLMCCNSIAGCRLQAQRGLGGTELLRMLQVAALRTWNLRPCTALLWKLL
jgi:hypothetical protein